MLCGNKDMLLIYVHKCDDDIDLDNKEDTIVRKPEQEELDHLSR